MSDDSRSHDLAKAIAPLLGAGWAYAPPAEPYPTAFIKGPDERELSVHVKTWGADAGKATIGCHLPSRDRAGKYVEPMKYGEKRPSIGVDAKRDPAAIAADIQRRLLPTYEAAFTEAAERISAQNAHIDDTAATLEALFQAAPGLLGNKRGDGSDRSASFYRDNGYGDVRVCGTSVQIELRSLHRDQAIKVLQAVAKALES